MNWCLVLVSALVTYTLRLWWNGVSLGTPADAAPLPVEVPEPDAS